MNPLGNNRASKLRPNIEKCSYKVLERKRGSYIPSHHDSVHHTELPLLRITERTVDIFGTSADETKEEYACKRPGILIKKLEKINNDQPHVMRRQQNMKE
jgi:hypothetical protein